MRVTSPECLPSDEIMQSDAKEEDEDETNIDNNWNTSSRNKKKIPGNKHSSDEVANSRNNYEVLESDLED